MIKIIHENGQVETLRPKKQEQRPAKSKIRVLEDRPSIKTETAPPAKQADPADAVRYDNIVVEMGRLLNSRRRVSNHLVDVYETAGLERRLNLVTEIRELKEQYNNLAVLRKYYETHGCFPRDEKNEKPKLNELQKHELFRRLTNVRTNISKAKRMLDKHQLNPEKVVQYEQKIAALEAEKEEINELLRS
jgi:DNA repair exonuclease SbcCD ATPase subunit